MIGRYQTGALLQLRKPVSLDQTVCTASVKISTRSQKREPMTGTKAEAIARRAANAGFSALLFALFGWVNLEALLLTSGGTVGGQVVACGLGLYLSFTAYRRYQLWWLPLARAARARPPEGKSRAGRIASACGLAAAGFALACAVRTESFAAAIVVAAIAAFIPWLRSDFCVRYFFASHALLMTGGLPVLVIGAAGQHPVLLLANTWVLWVPAAALLLSTARSQKRAERALAPSRP